VSYTGEIATYQQPVLIYNPAAGKFRRNPERTLQRTTDALGRASLRPLLIPTEEAGHATELAAEAVRDGADLILVLGGDGTINEVVNGMIGSRAHLGVLPGGTANVLAMELGLGSSLERAIGRLALCAPRQISIGRLCQPGKPARHFLMMAGAGFDAQVVCDLNPGLKAKTGKLAYWVAGFSQIVKRVGQLETRINGDTYPCGFTLAARVRNYGGDLELARGASLLNDEFETVMFEGSNPLRYAFYMLAVAVKQVQKMPGVHTVRSKRVELAGDAPIQIDGEYVGRSPATIEIVPDALTLLVPESYG
jgi:diacylglycerol kinase (ATP)